MIVKQSILIYNYKYVIKVKVIVLFRTSVFKPQLCIGLNHQLLSKSKPVMALYCTVSKTTALEQVKVISKNTYQMLNIQFM